jgi:hypothetical protein
VIATAAYRPSDPFPTSDFASGIALERLRYALLGSSAGASWEYARHAGIEGTLSEGARGSCLRRCRYVGLAKAHLQHGITAAAMNPSRLAAWQTEAPRAKTRASRLARLAPAG